MKRSEFESEARALVSAFASITSNSLEREDNDNDPISLIHWVVEESADPNNVTRSNVLLSHPPFLRPYSNDASTVLDDCKNNSIITPTSIEEDEEDDSIEIDEAAAISTTEPSQSLDHNHNMKMAEWIFNICYSDSWTVPVLYFRCQRIDGTTLSRSEVLHALNYSDDNNNTTTTGDSWDFVSQEEHPVTGVPSFFLHPCQTLSILKLLKNGWGDDAECPTGCLLLSWLSKVLPAVQCRISSADYARLREKLS